MKRLIVLVVIMFMVPLTGFAADINGLCAIVIGSGDIKPGAKINVFLTTKEIQFRPADYSKFGTIDEKLEKMEVNFDASKVFKGEKNNNPDYIKSVAMATLEGKFKFENIEAGQYFIVICFPSMVANNLVFWQVPITMKTENINIELSNDNLSLPAVYVR